MGDMSDNYPGVAGIGPKAATDLLTQYQNLDNIYSHIEEIKPSVKEKLVKEKDNAYLSQKLADLIDNIPLDLKLTDSKIGSSVISGLNSVFKNYHFKSLINRLSSLNQKVQPQQNSLF
jgi:DNA polymerase-1